MFNFLKKNLDKKNQVAELITKTASLLIHAAKIDQDYTQKEREIIQKALIELGAKETEINEIMQNAEINEEKSNQILEFTKEIKGAGENVKIKIIETIWKIIYSNKEVDMYESNLMSRLTGLIYLDIKQAASIKEKMKKKFS